MAGSSVIGALRVNLSIDTAQFADGLASAQSSLQRFGQLAKVGLVAAAAAGALAMAGLGKGIKTAIDSADDMSKAAQKIGIATDELSRLKYAADLSDVSFESLQASVGRLSKNIAQAAVGSGAGAKAFAALGISVRSADGSLKPTNEVLQDLADRFAIMPDGAQKTALAMQLMGRAGAQMIPLLNGGSAALAEMSAEADAFGIVVDTATGKAAERFNDALTKISSIASGVVTRFSGELAPALAAVAEAFVDAAKTSGGFASTIRSVANKAVDAALWVADAWFGLKLIFHAAEVAATGFALVVQKVAADVALYVTGMVDQVIAGLNTVISKSNEILGTNVGVIDPLGSSQWAKDVETNVLRAQQAFATARLKMMFTVKEGLPSEGIRKSIDEMKAAGDAVNAAGDKAAMAGEKIAGGAKKAAGGTSEAARAMRELASEGQRVFEATRTPLEKYNLELQNLNKLLQAGAIDWDTYNRAVKQAQDDLDEANKQTNDVADTFASEFTSAFSSIIDGTKSVKDAFADLAKSLTQMFLNKALQSLFENLFGGLFGGSGGGPLNLGSFLGTQSAPAMAPANVGTSAGTGVTVINNTGQPSSSREVPDGQGGRRIEVVVGEMVATETGRPGSAMNRSIRQTFGVPQSTVRR